MDTTYAEVPAINLTAPELVQEYADLKVWNAVNVTTYTDSVTPEADARHHRLGAVVTELRRRGMLA